MFYDLILNVNEEELPSYKVTVNKHSHPWFTLQLGRQIKQRNYMFKKYTFAKNNNDKES